MEGPGGTAGRRLLIAEERQRRIEELLRRQAIASLAEVIEVTGASEPTARRDLAQMERLGLLARTRGGARAVQRHSTLEEEFEIRQARDRREKRLIAQRAAGLIEDGTALFLTDGTTAYAFAQCLVRRHLTVITGALNIAQLLAGSAGIEVVVLGGLLRATSFGTTGSISVDTIRSLHADVAVIAPDGITVEGGVRTLSLDDAASARAMTESASRTVALASPGKVGVAARARVVGWDRVDTLVTASLPPEFARGVAQHGVEVQQVT
jgi:DeoR/GlpR family transcriptional regulator of sugar metabolism